MYLAELTGIEPALTGRQPVVFAVPAEFNIEQLGHIKIGWRGTNPAYKQRRTERAGPVRNLGHGIDQCVASATGTTW